MKITLTQKGNYLKITRYLQNAKKIAKNVNLDKYGRAGVIALSAGTPKDTGLTANSWSYKITNSKGTYTISFYNSNIQNGVPIAIILQYGHAAKDGGWIQGRDYINPAIRPIFDKLTKDAWEEVKSL